MKLRKKNNMLISCGIYHIDNADQIFNKSLKTLSK